MPLVNSYSLPLVLIMAATLALPSISNGQEGEELKKIEKQITDSTRKTRELEARTQNVGAEIDDIRQKLVLTASNMREIEAKVTDRENKLEELDQQEQDLETSLQSRYRQMARTLGAMQRLSQQPAELVLFRPDERINSLRSSSLLNVVLPELKDRAALLKQDLTDLEDVRVEISDETRALQEELKSLVATQDDMNLLLAERRKKQQELERATRKERQKLKQFAAKAKSLQDLIAKIEEEARLREEAALAAARRLEDKPGSKTTTPKKTVARPTPAVPTGNKFAAAKGNIPLPVVGVIRQRYGQTTSQGQRSKGIVIRTRPQATVVAPFDGRIVFAGKFRSYGQLLIIAHGDGYHTLLAGMNRIDGVVGQWILKGEPVGQMHTKTSGALASSSVSGQNKETQNLYVEIRRGGKPINPLPWIAARDRKVVG